MIKKSKNSVIFDPSGQGSVLSSVPHESNRIELSQIRIRFDRITNRIWMIRIRTNRIWTIRIRFGLDLIRFGFDSIRTRFDSIWLNSIQFDSIWLNLTQIDSIWFQFDSDSVNSDSIQIRFDSDRIEFHQFGFDSQITNPNRIRIRIWIWFDSTNRLRNPNVNAWWSVTTLNFLPYK